MKLDHAKYFVAFMTVAGAACVVSILSFLILPVMRDLGDLSRKIVEAETEVQSQYTHRRTLLDSIEKLKEVRLSMKGLASQFIAKSQELDFITTIESVGDAHGIETRLSLAADPGTAAGEFKQGFSLRLVGAYADAMKTLAEIERLPIMVTIDAMQINGGETAAPSASTPITIDLRGRIASPPKSL